MKNRLNFIKFEVSHISSILILKENEVIFNLNLWELYSLVSWISNFFSQCLCSWNLSTHFPRLIVKWNYIVIQPKQPNFTWLQLNICPNSWLLIHTPQYKMLYLFHFWNNFLDIWMIVIHIYQLPGPAHHK